jgi:L-alanine-DL-glutamate epimerase-like enolase superfamily enzyme
MRLSFKPYKLELKYAFTLAKSSRTSTQVILTEIEFNDKIGYGEASLPPYLSETTETVFAFLSKVDLSSFKDPFDLSKIISYIDSIAPGNTAAKASVDIALHDLLGKLLEKPLHKIWGLKKNETPDTSFTIGIDKPDIIRKKVEEASEYKILKIKLGRENDKELINTVRLVTNKPIIVDVNEGWKDKNFALDMIYWLNERNVMLIEQPVSKENIEDMAWLTENSPLPTIADEFVQRLSDIQRAYKVYSGVNIKLMKCTGLNEAYKMINNARSLGMKVMIGCMTETSCAISAASQLSPLADWADLDGNLLIKNDPYVGTKIINGKIVLNDLPGIGLKK